MISSDVLSSCVFCKKYNLFWEQFKRGLSLKAYASSLGGVMALRGTILCKKSPQEAQNVFVQF